MKYEYKFIPISQWLTKKRDDETMGDTLAKYIKEKTDKQIEEGWEYYRTDTYTVNEQPGCFASLFGAKEKVATYNLLVFRKEII